MHPTNEDILDQIVMTKAAGMILLTARKGMAMRYLQEKRMTHIGLHQDDSVGLKRFYSAPFVLSLEAILLLLVLSRKDKIVRPFDDT